MSYRFVVLYMTNALIPRKRDGSDIREAHEALAKAINAMHVMFVIEMHWIILLSVVLGM